MVESVPYYRGVIQDVTGSIRCTWWSMTEMHRPFQGMIGKCVLANNFDITLAHPKCVTWAAFAVPLMERVRPRWPWSRTTGPFPRWCSRQHRQSWGYFHHVTISNLPKSWNHQFVPQQNRTRIIFVLLTTVGYDSHVTIFNLPKLWNLHFVPHQNRTRMIYLLLTTLRYDSHVTFFNLPKSWNHQLVPQ